VVALSARWPFSRTTDRPAPRPDRLLRDNPALLLSALQAPETVAGLIAEWNPTSAAGAATPAATAAPTANAPATEIAEGIRWHGPIRLTPILRADAGLPTAGPASSLGLAYVAEVRRERAKIGDSRHADHLRQRYPHGLPTGAEAEAWQLVRGLAKRLRGVARLPGGPVHSPHQGPPLPGDTDHAVFSHEMLPWLVLREILRPIAPDLACEMVPDGGGYILRHRELVGVRVRPTGPGTRLPHALRDRADDAWPRSIYEFCDLSAPAAGRTGAAPAVKIAAALIAEVTGGVLLDADGFPQAAQTFAGS
jgi:hypothetical protein